MFKEFKAFILRGNVIELAVAVVIGAAFKSVVDSVTDLITNLVAIPSTCSVEDAKSGMCGFSSLQFTIGGGTFKYGVVINNTITFLAVAAVIFFLIVRPLNKLAERRKAGVEPEPEARPEDILLLEEIRDLLKTRA